MTWLSVCGDAARDCRIVILALVAGVVIVVWQKGRPFTAGDVFRASRLSSGNHLFPTQVAITPTSVVHYTPSGSGGWSTRSTWRTWRRSGSITKLLFSDVYIETTGGVNPIHCQGHRKADAVRMKELIERYQSEYYSRERPDR